MINNLYARKGASITASCHFRSASRLSDSLPALIRFPVPARVARKHRRSRQRPLSPEQAPVVGGAFVRIRESGVGGVDLHEFVRGRVFLVDRRHVRVADSGQSPVRGLDFLAGGTGGDAEDIVEGRAGGAQIRRAWFLRPGRASFLGGGGGGGGEGHYWAGSNATGRRGLGFTGEVNGWKRRLKGHRRNHVW